MRRFEGKEEGGGGGKVKGCGTLLVAGEGEEGVAFNSGREEGVPDRPNLNNFSPSSIQ